MSVRPVIFCGLVCCKIEIGLVCVRHRMLSKLCHSEQIGILYFCEYETSYRYRSCKFCKAVLKSSLRPYSGKIAVLLLGGREGQCRECRFCL